MRLIKLSTDQFPLIIDVKEYFREELHDPDRYGMFHFPKGWIAHNGLNLGETVLFSYLARVRYIASAGTGRLQNRDDQVDQFPYFFQIKMETLRQVDFSVRDLERNLRNKCGLTKSILITQGWPILPDSDIAAKIVQSLSRKKKKRIR